MNRRWVLVVVGALAVLVLACTNGGGIGGPSASPPAPVPGFPSSLAALGDSISAGYGSCLAPSACPRNSWSTGDGFQVKSHYRRILAINPAIGRHARNLAEPGAKAADLDDQAAEAVRAEMEYITLQVGANDACDGTMTSAAVYRAGIDKALATLKSGLPQARLLLVSLPNVYRVWELGRVNRFVVGVWKSGACPNLLENATSNAKVDVARRQAFRARIAAYNTQLKDACADYGPRCRYVHVADFAFDLNMLSAIDFFHPNAAGQNALAELTYPGTFTW
jgi:lysophospholipase L1-like esterase